MAEEKTESQKKLEESRKELAEKNQKIQSFFKKMRKRLVDVGTRSVESAKAIGSYLKTLESVATASVSVAAEMSARGLTEAKRDIDSKLEAIAESARDKVAAARDNATESVRKRKSASDRVGKKADKAAQKVEQASEVKARSAERHSNTKRNKGTRGAAVYSKAEKTSRTLRTGAAKRVIAGVKILGMGIAFVKPDSKVAEQMVEDAGKSAARYVKRESRLDSSVKKAVDRVHDAEDSVRTTKRAVKRDKDNLERARRKEAQEITSGKKDREGASRFTRDVTRGIRLASLAKRNLQARAGITITGVKSGIDRLFGRKSKARDSQVSAYRDAKKTVSQESPVADTFDRKAENVENAVRTASQATARVGRTITNGVTVAVGGVVQSVSDVGKKAIGVAKKVEEDAREKAQELEDGVRAAGKYLASAPDRIETASRKGVSELLNNMAAHTQSLADKISPKTHDEEDRGTRASLEMARA